MHLVGYIHLIILRYIICSILFSDRTILRETKYKGIFNLPDDRSI